MIIPNNLILKPYYSFTSFHSSTTACPVKNYFVSSDYQGMTAIGDYLNPNGIVDILASDINAYTEKVDPLNNNAPISSGENGINTFKVLIEDT
jgi:hypothetical protein